MVLKSRKMTLEKNYKKIIYSARFFCNDPFILLSVTSVMSRYDAMNFAGTLKTKSGSCKTNQW